MTSILEGQLSKIWSFPIKTKVTKALGIYRWNMQEELTKLQSIHVSLKFCPLCSVATLFRNSFRDSRIPYPKRIVHNQGNIIVMSIAEREIKRVIPTTRVTPTTLISSNLVVFGGSHHRKAHKNGVSIFFLQVRERVSVLRNSFAMRFIFRPKGEREREHCPLHVHATSQRVLLSLCFDRQT